MTNILRLDAKTINLLFPEDSEYRAEITNVVAAEVTRKMFTKDILAQVQQNILGDQFVSEAVHRKAVELYSVEHRFDSSRDYLSERTKSLIGKNVAEAVRQSIALNFTPVVKDAVDAAIERANDSDYLKNMIDAALNKELDVKIKEIVKSKLANIDIGSLF